MTAKTYEFEVGSFRCISISDGYQPIGKELLSQFFVGSSKNELELMLKKHEISPHGYELQCNCLLIDTGHERVLVDSGGGPFYDPYLGNLVPHLASEGYRPEDISTIVLTHRHRDHVCGSVNQDGSLIFPNARHVMVRKEWEYWAREADVMVLGEDHAAEIQFTRDCLLAIKDQLQLIEPDAEILPGIRALPTPGHTRNHISVDVISDDNHLICVADTMDLPIHVENTTWHPGWDELPEQGIETRRKLLQWAVDQSALIHGFHFPFPGVGIIKQDGEGWQFEPIDRN